MLCLFPRGVTGVCSGLPAGMCQACLQVRTQVYLQFLSFGFPKQRTIAAQNRWHNRRFGCSLCVVEANGCEWSLLFSFIPLFVFFFLGGSTVCPTGSLRGSRFDRREIVFRPTGSVSRRVDEGLCKILL